MELLNGVLGDLTDAWGKPQSRLQSPTTHDSWSVTMCFEAPKLQTVQVYTAPPPRTLRTRNNFINSVIKIGVRQQQYKKTVCSVIGDYLPKRRIKKTYSTRRLEFHRDSLYEHCNLSIEKCRIVSATWQADWIDDKNKPGNVCSEGEIRSVGGGGSVRIHHLTGVSPDGRSRFPKLEECAHFHYEHVELGPLQISLCDDEDLKPIETEGESKSLTVRVTSAGQSWLLRRTYDNFRMLDQQLHRCIYDRKFSNLTELPDTPDESQENLEKVLSTYLARLSAIAGSLMNCGPVLSWLELDNRGRRLLVTEGDSCPINTPAVAAAYSIKKYTAVAADEISFDIGDMISVIDMPPPEESAWWRGKRGFLVGFFPSHCVAVITDKLPRNLNLHQSLTLAGPTKPVLRKHGKLIAFFRAFILSRPSRRRLKQSGILKERVFGCDLGEHLLNSGHEIPMVLKCCAEFIESHGIVDGIYRLSGVTSNIQKLRRTFDEDRVPALYDDEAILQDIHSVASLLKMYFRELPNPLCTYQLYEAFVTAVQADKESDDRLLRMRETVEKLPPPHYRTLEYLMRHLARVSEKGTQTGMTARNIAIVWAPNLLRCKELEVGGVAALQGVGVQAVVTEFLIVYADLIFCSAPLPVVSSSSHVTPKKTRPKSLAISTPTKLLSLEEAQSRALASGKPEQDYIEVGGGPSCLPAKYHTIIELPRKRPGSKRSPLGWKSLFTKASRHGSVGTRKSRSPAATPADQRKSSVPSDIVFGHEKALTESDLTSGRRRLRPVKSAESLASAGQTSARSSGCLEPPSPPSPQIRSVQPPGHNRSVSHDSYFDTLAETPQRSQEQTSSQLLQEEDEEGLSLSLDLSELQVNFDLEESEMRIFSEDETNQLFSSHNSLENNQVCKRQPLLARAEDSSSADPSPKKHKTGNTICAVNNRSKRSRLEERLSSSSELRYIDSGSPDQHVQINVEVHTSPSRSHSPSLAEATVSENESLTLSGLTTPDTPTPRLHYTPLTEDSLSDAVTTPEYHKLGSSPFPSPSNNFHISGYENLPRDRLSYPGETLGTRYENIPRDRLSFQGILRNGDVGLCEKHYENKIKELNNTNDVVQYENLSNQQFVTLGSDVNCLDEVMCDMKVDDVKYEEIKESSIYESVDDAKKTMNFYENILPHLDDESELYEPIVRKDLDCSYEEISGRECLLSDRIQKEGLSSSGSLISPVDINYSKENEYECLVVLDSSPDNSKHVPDSNQNLCSPEAINPEEHLYEDVQTASLPDSIVYQQVKYLRRSVHEINQLLEDSMEPFTGEDVSSLEEEETALISPMNNNGIHDVAANGVEPKSDSILVSSDKPVSSVFSVSVDQTLSISLSKKFEEAQLKSSESAGAPTVQSESVTSVSPSQIVDSNNDLLVYGIETDKDLLCENSTMDDVEAISSSFEDQEKCVEMLCDDSKSGSSGGEKKNTGAKTSLRQSTTSSNKIQKDSTVIDSKTSNKENTEPSKESQARKIIQNLDENRRKFESEIGRDIVRERKMRQELEANSSSTGNSTAGRNVQELMSRFEWTHSDKEPIPPCLKARMNRQNSKDKTPNLTTSLDGSSFPCEASQLPRVKTSPDLNQNQEELMKTVKPVGELIDSDAIRRERIEKYKEERRTFLRKKYRTDSFNNNDDKDEEMIRRLKAKTINNRTSESSDTVEENALNATQHLSESSDVMEWTRRSPTRKREVSESNSYTESGEKESENRYSKSKSEDVKPVKRSPSRTTVSISYSPTKSKAASWENSLKRNSKTSEIERVSDSCKNRNVCSSPRTDKSDYAHETASTKSDLKHNRPDDLNLSGVPSRRKEEVRSPNISVKMDRRPWRGFEAQNREGTVDKSPDDSLVARRVNQLSASSDTVRNDIDKITIQRRTSLTDNIKHNSSVRQRANSSSSSNSARSPSYCIRDMAAMFENRDIK